MRLLDEDMPLPAPEDADARGLVAVGGDLSPRRLLDAYCHGIFPWYEEGLPILWHSPDPRMVLRCEDLVINRSLRKRLRRGDYEVAFDRNFSRVIRECASVYRPGQSGTWITNDMIRAYERLHDAGHVHSVEAYSGGELVGGLYGLSVGGVFCGESMFAHADDASKVAFVHLVQQLHRWGVELVDCQVYTEHLARFGAIEWPRKVFLAELRRLRGESRTRRVRWTFDDDFRVSTGT